MITNKSLPARRKVKTYLFRRTSARRSRCSSAASVGGPTEIPGRKIFTTAVSRNRTTTPIVDFICVEHSSPHGPASTDRTNSARLTGKQMIVRINDRGPFASGRVISGSRPAAELRGRPTRARPSRLRHPSPGRRYPGRLSAATGNFRRLLHAQPRAVR